MHPKKAELLKRLDETSRLHDVSLRRSVDIAVHPDRHGWRTSLLTAAIVVPLTGVSAVFADVTRVLLSRSDDEAWERGTTPPSTDETGGDGA
jgi:hypothetical protein